MADFNKISTSLFERLKLLKSKNLVINDEYALSNYMKTVNTYYHLIGYRFLLPNYDPEKDDYCMQNANCLIALCELDKKISIILFPYIREIEQSIRAKIADLCKKDDMLSFKINKEEKRMDIVENYQLHNNKKTPFIKSNNLVNTNCTSNSQNYKEDTNKHMNLYKKLYLDIEKVFNEPAIAHYINEYDGIIPIWVLVNYVCYGSLISLLDELTTNKISEFMNSLSYRKANKKTDARRSDFCTIRIIRNKISHFLMMLGKDISVPTNSHESNNPSNNYSMISYGIICISRVYYFLFGKNIYENIIDKINKSIDDINHLYSTEINYDIIKKIVINYDNETKNKNSDSLISI